MEPKTENPTRAAQGFPKSDLGLAGSLIVSENTPSLRNIQARRLTRRHAVSFELAAAIAPIVYGEVAP
ncbi:hypothetical protein JQ615_18405 [Bradyrhizobium jicamae]|uniref:Uncharacterized protein n=1 Tax=Bradyrhizobium jicamae TaxID=280332 RepID=A0ABS5FKP6_9BRAD|nr:hypothetical protein [Bradyrhizobium jicamae]MBR0797363.1 hypothetical protein [Bradyrhizobium jicamae]